MSSELVVPAGVKREIVIVHSVPKQEELVVRLCGEGAEVRIEEVFLSDGESNIVVIHEAPRTISKVNTRGIVRKGERVTAHAKVMIPKGTDLCDSFVSQKFMLLDTTARADAVPSLEIEADEVKAGHSTAVCPIDESTLFYLASRGVDLVSAKKMLIEGFLKIPKDYEQVFEKWQG